ncbi:MAG: cytochrome P450, partial [Acidimicrobiales bacterium]
MIEEPYSAYEWLRRESPVHRLEHPSAWVLSRYGDVHAALRDPGTFSSGCGVTFNNLGGIGSLIGMDAPDHTRLRRILSAAFTPRAVASLEPVVARLTSEMLAGIAGRPQIDVVADLAAPFPTLVIASLLGIDPAGWPTYKRWSDQLNAISWSPDPPETVAAQLGQAGLEAALFFMQEMQVRREAPRADLITHLLGAQGHDATTDSEIVSFCVLILLAGNVTTTALLASSLCLLADHPGVLAQLHATPALIPAAVEEMIRLESPIQGFCRTVTTDMEMHGQQLRAGEKVLLLFGSANRDRDVFSEAGSFRLDRSPNPHLGFGAGAHLCLG